MSVIPESGVRSRQIVFSREENGTLPQGPQFKLFSDNVRSISWGPDNSKEAQRGLGTADPRGFFSGPESHDFSITYDMQRSLEDGGDPAYDGMARDEDDRLPNTHSIREKNVVANGGALNGGYKIFTVAKRAKIGNPVIPGELSDGQPVQAELSYQAEKIRSYRIDQPSGEATLAAKSTNSDDDSQSLHIESNEGSITADVSLNGNTPVNTTASFPNIDALELDSETIGNVIVTNSDDSATLAQINGADEYDGIEGDLGVPGIDDSGSYQESVGKEYERFVKDEIERPADEELAYNVSSCEFSVDNALDTSPRPNTKQQRIQEGERTTEITATVHGADETHDKIMDYLKNNSKTLKRKMTHSTLVATNAVITDPGSRDRSPDESFYQFDVTFESEGLNI